MRAVDRLFLPRVHELALGESRIFAHEGGTKPFVSVVVVRSRVGLAAYWNVCQHIPVPLDSGCGALPPGDDLVCLTHGARFRADDGYCIAGPCSGTRLQRLNMVQDEAGWWAEIAPGD
ncbi:unnamed protein product [Laminaria digitata]